MSILVRATNPFRIPRRVQIWRCSRVCGMTPSSAAITITTRSMPAAPATMFRTNRSWPGTSTTPEDPAVGEGQRGEAELDGDPPLFFLLEPVGVHAGETFDQRRLAVVHVAGRTHHDMLHARESSRLIRFSQQQIWILNGYKMMLLAPAVEPPGTISRDCSCLCISLACSTR